MFPPTFYHADGKGDPNADFSERVMLCSLAYAIKMNYKRQRPRIYRFTVHLWKDFWQQDKAGELIKEELIYTIMFGQPDFIMRDGEKGSGTSPCQKA